MASADGGTASALAGMTEEIWSLRMFIGHVWRNVQTQNCLLVEIIIRGAEDAHAGSPGTNAVLVSFTSNDLAGADLWSKS